MGESLTVAGVPVYRDSAGVLREAKGQDEIAALAGRIEQIDREKANASTVGGIATALNGKADASALPKPATTTPKSEMTGGAAGSQDPYARADHQHPRLTSTTYATLGANSQATVAFSRPFTNKPGINPTEVDAVASSQPLVLRAIGWVQDANGLYTGVIIQGSRAQLLPELTPVSAVLSLLGTAIGAINTNILTPLTKYNIFGGSAAGASVSVIAVARSDVPAT